MTMIGGGPNLYSKTQFGCGSHKAGASRPAFGSADASSASRPKFGVLGGGVGEAACGVCGCCACTCCGLPFLGSLFGGGV